jgi:hypothetical protein
MAGNKPKVGPFEEYSDKYEQWFIKHQYIYKSELLAIKKQLPLIRIYYGR